MLPIEHRLKYKKDFDIVFAKGLKVFVRGLTLRFVPRFKPDAPSRMGFVVSTKVSKNAVERNRLRRRLREAARENIKTLRLGFDLVIITFPEAKDFSLSEARQSLTALLMKAGLYAESSSGAD